MKKCNSCLQAKSVSEYHKDRSRADGLTDSCKSCQSARIRAHREANKEQIAARDKAYYEANRGAYSIKARQRVQSMARRTPSWADSAAIEAVYAETRELGLTVDHYYPLCGKTVSGLHVAANLRAISQRENDMKGNKHPEEFYGPNGWRLG